MGGFFLLQSVLYRWAKTEPSSYKRLPMLLVDKTLSELNLNCETLSKNSHKNVLVKCDYCDSEYQCSMKNRTASFSKYPKDCCKKCRYKKREEVSLSLHGVKNPSQRKDVRDKIRESNKDWINSEEFNAQRSSSMLKKYGTDNVLRSEEIKSKILSTMRVKYGVDNAMKIPGVAESASRKSINTKISKGIIKTIDGMTLPEKALELGLSRSFFGKMVKTHGIDYALSYQKQFSSLENIVYDFLISLPLPEGKAISRNSTISRKKPDIVVGDVIIECDGLYWHSDAFIADKNYHLDKMSIYKSLNYKPLFFRGDEIIDKFDIVCSIIKNALNLNDRRLFARKLSVVEIEGHVAQDFCDKNHLMGGFKSSSRSFALLSEDGIESVLQVKLINKALNQYDLSRYCTSAGTTIPGGFSKLLKHFEKVCNPSYFQTFVDLRYGSGDYLHNLGFVQGSCYPSFRWTNGTQTFHRSKFKGTSGYENNMNRIWDCGQRKMVKAY